jgi:hypothetical protein
MGQTVGGKKSKARVPVRRPSGRLGLVQARRRLFCRLKPCKPLKTLIPHERIQGNPNPKNPFSKPISRPDRGSPATSKRRICFDTRLPQNFRPAPRATLRKQTIGDPSRRETAENGGRLSAGLRDSGCQKAPCCLPRSATAPKRLGLPLQAASSCTRASGHTFFAISARCRWCVR